MCRNIEPVEDSQKCYVIQYGNYNRFILLRSKYIPSEMVEKLYSIRNLNSVDILCLFIYDLSFVDLLICKNYKI